MTAINMTLYSIPEIGFAHHFYAENYRQIYGIQDSSFEIVYIKSGRLLIQLEEQHFEAVPGSVFLLCRSLPIRLYSMDNTPHSHCSIQLKGSFCADVFKDNSTSPDGLPSLLLPLVLPPSAEAERIGRTLHQIIAKLQASRPLNAHSCALSAMGILADLDNSYREQLSDTLPSSVMLSTKVKAYIDSHIQQEVSLGLLADSMGRSPNYLNSIFKQTNGIPIRQYINQRKAILIAELMVNKGADFRTACENAGISDIAYGYRLFKKQLGTTPQQYTSAVLRRNF